MIEEYKLRLVGGCALTLFRNTRTQGHPVKLISERFRADPRKCMFAQCIVL